MCVRVRLDGEGDVGVVDLSVVDLSVVDLIKIRVFVCLKFGSGLVGIIGWVGEWVCWMSGHTPPVDMHAKSKTEFYVHKSKNELHACAAQNNQSPHLSGHVLNHHTQARDAPVGDEAAVDDASEQRHVNVAAGGDDAHLRV